MSAFSPSAGEYSPELIALMTDALNAAWRQQTVARSHDADLARLVMASAIIEHVDAGVRLHEELVIRATRALTAAIGLSRGSS